MTADASDVPPVDRALADGGVRVAAPASPGMARLAAEIAGCRVCAGRFAATATGHAPRPVLRLSGSARLLVAGQAPGARVHASGVPFDDASGDRLRDWMGVSRAVFHDAGKVAIAPMAFCFPGYDAKGSDLPPPPECARRWRARVLGAMPQVELTLLVGGHAQAWALGPGRVDARVRGWRAAPAGVICLPHPSWRNTGWLRRNPWFEAEVVPRLRARVAELLR